MFQGVGVAEHRYKKGLTLQDLSRISGINAGTINRIEQGVSSPRPKTAKALCEALGADFNDLFIQVAQKEGVSP